MFQALARTAGRVANFFRKSSAEKKLLAMLNSHSTLIAGNLWNNDRARLVEAYRGWNYTPIHAVASEIAGMEPQFAYKRDARTAKVEKCLSKFYRAKALTSLQSNVELELIERDHRLNRLNAKPNPIDVAWTYWYKVAMFLHLTGEVYLWDVPDGLGRPAESWVIPSHWVWPLPGKSHLIEDYEVRPVATSLPYEGGPGNWMWFAGASGKFKIPADQIVPIFLPGPYSLFGGHSPVAAGAAWTDCSNNIDSSRLFKFQNDAFPNVAVVFDKEIDPDSISQPEIDRLKLMIKEKYSGVKRTGEPAVLGPGMSLQVLSSTPRDMDYVDGADQLRNSLMALHRTGPSVVGMAEETTYAASRASRSAWHTSTIKPDVLLFGQCITEHRCKKFDDDIVCYWPDATPDDAEFEHKRRMESVTNNVITINEARAELGREPIKGGDVTLIEWEAEHSVPKGLGAEPGLLDAPTPDPNNGRMDQIFHPGSNGNGNGKPMTPEAKKSLELARLSRRLLLAG